jgi:hypothetical protein
MSANAGARRRSLAWTRRLAAWLAALALSAPAQTALIKLDKPNTPTGYLARLLINEASFPGERAYLSEADSQSAMLAILWVLHSRMRHIPAGYTQEQVAGVRSTNIIEVITGGGGKRQCEGFYLDAAGRYVTAPRVEARVSYLSEIASRGGKPGRFSRLLNYAQGLACAYTAGGIEGADRFAGLTRVGKLEVTGRAYSWMTDTGTFHPGGNFVAIPNTAQGSLAGNRFFTLRKAPK